MSENEKTPIPNEPTGKSLNAELAPLGQLLQPVVKVLQIIALIAVCLVVYHRYFAPKVVTLDLLRFNQEQETRLTEGKITEEQALERLAIITNRLNELGERVVVIRKDMVIGNAPEIPLE